MTADSEQLQQSATLMVWGMFTCIHIVQQHSYLCTVLARVILLLPPLHCPETDGLRTWQHVHIVAVQLSSQCCNYFQVMSSGVNLIFLT